MTFEKAKQEFEIRFYFWGISEFEKEIDESFPNLRSFKSGTAWETYQFMQQLDKNEQLTLMRGLLKRNNDAIQALGENCSIEEESLRSRRDDFFRIRGLNQFVQRLEKDGQMAEARSIFQRFRPAAVKVLGEIYLEDEKSLRSRLNAIFRPIPSTFEEEIAARTLAGEKIKFASKRNVRKAMIAKFKSAFGNQCIGSEYLVAEPEPQFLMKCCGWILSTDFWFGQRKSSIEYSHTISSEDSFEHEGPEGIYRKNLIIGFNISFCSWLGITGATQWEYLMDEDVEPACDAVIKQCGHFLRLHQSC
jgi:hypothetical protein